MELHSVQQRIFNLIKKASEDEGILGFLSGTGKSFLFKYIEDEFRGRWTGAGVMNPYLEPDEMIEKGFTSGLYIADGEGGLEKVVEGMTIEEELIKKEDYIIISEFDHNTYKVYGDVYKLFKEEWVKVE